MAQPALAPDPFTLRQKQIREIRECVLYYLNSLSIEDQESLLGIVEVYSKRFSYKEALRNQKLIAHHTLVDNE